jgi:subtilisin family serine protease
MKEISMAQEKDERPNATVRKAGEVGEDSTRKTDDLNRRTTQGRSVPRDSGNGGDGGLTAAAPGMRRERYLIGVRAAPVGQPYAVVPQSMDEVVEYLNHQENVEVIKRIKLGGTQPFTLDGRSVSEVVVARIDESRARRLRAIAPPHLIIERDFLLRCADHLSIPVRVGPIGTLLPLRSVTTEIGIRVIGERDQPLARATVVIDGGGLPAQGLTDESGTARLTLFGSSLETIHTLFVRAPANHWDRLIPAPRLSSGINTIKLRPLSESYPTFPTERLFGWGQRLMGIDLNGARLSGRGVRIGIIDSGCDNTHPLLRHVTQGRDFTTGGIETKTGVTDTTWAADPLSHGTHCAGIISASSVGAAQGIAGTAPEAELHALKVMPEGRVSDLLAALDECIQRELDLVSVSVVSDGFSELVSQKLQEVRQKGIACIVAAGNTGGPVAYPATLPWVMAVAAVGKLNEFPSDSSHTLSVIPQLIGSDEIFSASFSSAGPQVGVSAPGVAVISAVPGGYAAADGTSGAAAHVTGFAALILAHHPLFQEDSLRARGEQRVHALFELIRASAVPHFPNPQRAGAGVPNLARVPGVQGYPMGTSDSPERVVMPGQWPATMPGVQGWPAWLPTRAVAAPFY